MKTAIQLDADELEGTAASVSQWLVKVGDKVTDGQPVVELETDKVSMEVCASQNGTLSEIVINSGEEVTPESILGYLSDDNAAQAETSDSGITEVEVSPGVQDSGSAKAKRQPLSPAVRRLVKEHGINLADITGTGKDGRICRRDIESYLASQEQTTAEVVTTKAVNRPQPATNTDNRNPSDRVPHSRMRKRIADRMVTSLLHTSPHVTSVFEMDMTNIIEHRKWHKNACQRQGFNLTFTAYFAYAAALAAKEVPEVNSRFHDDSLEIFKHVNIGIGTALGDDGLVVPVIRNVDQMELYDIANALNLQTDKARKGQLTPEDVKGSTLTISNHGVSGSLFATPIIINQPEVAIIGVGKLEKRAVVREMNGEDQIVIRPMAYISLTIDHRALDAFQTNRYLGRFVDIIEQWQG